MTTKQEFQYLPTKPRKIKPAIGAAALLAFTLFLIGPSYLYFTNLLEIPYYYNDMVWVFAGYSLAAGALILVLLLSLKGNVHRRMVALVFVLGLLFWIQGNFLVWDYGVLDGRPIIWKDHLFNGIIDSAIWIAVLTVALIKGPTFFKHIAWASAVLILIQGSGLAVEIFRAPREPEWKSYVIGYDDKTMFEFSSEQNVIILVLDMFQSDIFQEIIDEDTEFRDMFDGFTFYRNTVGGFPTTYPSVTFILTGRYYDNSIPIQDFIKREFLANSLPLYLKEEGYQVDLHEMTAKNSIYVSDKVCSNADAQRRRGKVDRRVDGRRAAGELLQLTFFRYVPQVFKRHFYFVPYIETSSAKQVDQDIVFYNSLASNTVISSKNKIFKYYHIKGAHTPYRINSKLQREKLPQDRSGCKEQARGVLRIAGELLRQLKRNDAYDQSMIFIIGDHGDPWGSAGLNAEPLGPAAKSEQDFVVDKKVICSGIPLMLMKPFNSAGDLRISDAPVSIGDIPQTIASELQLARTFPGRVIMTVDELEEREREYYYYQWSNKRWDYNYLPTMEKFVINGHSWLPDSWRKTGLSYSSQEEI